MDEQDSISLDEGMVKGLTSEGRPIPEMVRIGDEGDSNSTFIGSSV